MTRMRSHKKNMFNIISLIVLILFVVIVSAESNNNATTDEVCLSILQDTDSNKNGIMDNGIEYITVLNTMITTSSYTTTDFPTCIAISYFDLMATTTNTNNNTSQNVYTKGYNRMSCLCSKYTVVDDDTYSQVCCEGNQNKKVYIPINTTTTNTNTTSSSVFFSNTVDAYYANNNDYTKQLCEKLWKISYDHCNNTNSNISLSLSNPISTTINNNNNSNSIEEKNVANNSNITTSRNNTNTNTTTNNNNTAALIDSIINGNNNRRNTTNTSTSVTNNNTQYISKQDDDTPFHTNDDDDDDDDDDDIDEEDYNHKKVKEDENTTDTTTNNNTPYTATSNTNNHYHPPVEDDINKEVEEETNTNSSTTNTNTSTTKQQEEQTSTLDPRDHTLLYIVLPILCTLLIVLCFISFIPNNNNNDDNDVNKSWIHTTIHYMKTHFYTWVDIYYYHCHQPTSTTKSNSTSGKMLRDFPNNFDPNNTTMVASSSSSSSSSSSTGDCDTFECDDVEKGRSGAVFNTNNDDEYIMDTWMTTAVDISSAIAKITTSSDCENNDESFFSSSNQQQQEQSPPPQHRMSDLLDRLGLSPSHHHENKETDEIYDDLDSFDVVYDKTTSSGVTSSHWNDHQHHHGDRSIVSTVSHDDDNMSVYSLSGLSTVTSRTTHKISSHSKQKNNRVEVYSDDDDKSQVSHQNHHHNNNKMRTGNNNPNADNNVDECDGGKENNHLGRSGRNSCSVKNHKGEVNQMNQQQQPQILEKKIWESRISDEEKEAAWIEIMEQSLFYRQSDDYYTTSSPTVNHDYGNMRRSVAAADVVDEETQSPSLSPPHPGSILITPEDNNISNCISTHNNNNKPSEKTTYSKQINNNEGESSSYYYSSYCTDSKKLQPNDDQEQHQHEEQMSEKQLFNEASFRVASTTAMMSDNADGESIPTKLNARLRTMPSSLLDNTSVAKISIKNNLIVMNNHTISEQTDQCQTQQLYEVSTTSTTLHNINSDTTKKNGSSLFINYDGDVVFYGNKYRTALMKQSQDDYQPT